MDVRDIEHYLLLVGKELEALDVQEPIKLLLVGGGYMLAQIRNRTATDDIDAVWVYPEIYANSQVYRLFELAVQLVAADEGLGQLWLNIGVSNFIQAAGPLPKMKLWRKFGLLHVYFPTKDFILAHKLVAGRKKDQDDIEALCAQLGVTTRRKAQKILDKYISREIQENNHVAAKLDAFFIE